MILFLEGELQGKVILPNSETGEVKKFKSLIV